MKLKTFIYLALAGFLVSCASSDQSPASDPIQETIQVAEQQIGFQTELIEKSGKVLIPRTIKNDKIHYVAIDDWTSGFFAGTMWYMYDLTGDEKWKTLGVKYTEHLDSAKYLTWHHDVGFMINSSYGNALRVTGDTAYKSVMMEAARSLATRYRPVPGVIQSWDEDRGWQGKRGWMCPVIIDNMMNLELFFEATRISGDSSYYKMAVSHADVTMAHHFRDDFSSFHVVDYDKIKGGVRSRETAQGYAHESAWARGQAWAIYGYTVCYRETRDERYLKMAENIYNYLINHPAMPADLVPYWDFDAPNIPNEPRDASAAAIIASALYELSTYKQAGFKETADKIVASLSSPAYRAIVGTNQHFLLMHSVGSIPHGHEIDVPLNYADYYFLEALVRKQKIEKTKI